VALGEQLGVGRFHAAALSSFSAPRATILIALSGKGRCSALASSHGAHPLARESLPSPNIFGVGYSRTEGGAAMPQENYAAKQQRIGERLTRAMAKAHMDRRELAELTGYSEAQIVSWERGRARLYPIELIKLCHALDVKPEWLLCWERRLH
jgi:DNA-binding Xre family transcriptional regulator